MSYISLLNETNIEVDNLTSDSLSIVNYFSSLGGTSINNTIFTGSLTGLATSVANGSDLTYTYSSTTKTFTIQINNNSITNSKLQYSSVNLMGLTMDLGTTAYNVPLLYITNAMLTGSISLTKLESGTASYIVMANGLGLPTYTLVTGDIYNNPSGSFTIGVGAVTPSKMSKGTGQGQILVTGVSPYTQAFQTLNTTIVPQGTNLYYTTAQGQTDAKTAISVVSTGSEVNATYSSSTGVITIPAITTGSITPAKFSNGTAQYQTLITGATPFSPTYQTLNTSLVSENSQFLYYTTARAQTDARTAITGIAPILYNRTTGEINLTTVIDRSFYFNNTIVFYKGNNVQGGPYSAVFGTANSTNSGNIAIIDGTSNNQYAQLYCRSNIFGIQGNITTISLEKVTKITTGALSVLGGFLNLGVDVVSNAVLTLFSTFTGYNSSIFMDGGGALNIENNALFLTLLT